jgi:TetR/AcrR family transcriptional repressor of nem operon
MARPPQYDRQTVLDAATDLFWRRGYTATSLADILDATGFNRHSLYREFGDKDGLFCEALQNYRALYRSTIGDPLQTDTGLDAIRSLFDRRLPADLGGRGCFATNTLVEREQVCSEACALAAGFVDELQAGLTHAIRAAQAKGEVRPDRDPVALADYVVTTLQGLGVLSRLGLTDDHAQGVRDETLAYLAS